MHHASNVPVRALCALLLALTLALAARAPAAVAVRVRGGARIEAISRVTGAGLVQIRGTLTDDSGAPLARALVRLQPAGGSPSAGGLWHAGQCPKMPGVRRGEGDVAAETDGLGRFCLALEGLAAGLQLEVSYPGDDFHDPTGQVRLTVDSSRSSLELSFSPRPRFLALERSRHVIYVDSLLSPADVAADPLELELAFTPTGGARQVLARESTPAGSRTRFEIASAALGEPGPGKLAVSFGGSDRVQPREHEVVVERTARVTLALAGSITGTDPGSGLIIPVAVGSTLGDVPSGTVEATVDGTSVGTAGVERGSALIRAVFEAAPGKDATIVLRYLPDAPWWRPGDALRTTIVVAHPSAWQLWPWGLSALLMATWIVLAWRRPARVDRRRAQLSGGPPSGRASIEVIQRGPARSGWHGQVVDAHEGAPVAGAFVAVVVPTFGSKHAHPPCVTDDDGQFALPATNGSTEGARLAVHARWHTELSRPIPPPGRLQINLVTRRRALLGRLVDWADRMGFPWHRRVEPTPAEVRDVAGTQGLSQVASWADSVEVAAFGPEAVDETREAEVRGREPHWKAESDTSR